MGRGRSLTMLDYLRRLERSGITLWISENDLRYRAPRGVLTPTILNDLRTRKSDILRFLRDENLDLEKAYATTAGGCGHDRLSPFPLTTIQEAYWVGRRDGFGLGNVACHGYTEIDSRHLDLDRLCTAWRRLVVRHDMLRATILPDGAQQVAKTVPSYAIAELDLRAMSTEAKTSQLQQIRRQMSHQVMEAGSWPLFQIRATRLSDEAWRLHMSFDLLILDLWSKILLFDEWRTLYRSPETTLPPIAYSFRDYVLNLNRLRYSSSRITASDYWWDRIETIPPAPELPMKTHPSNVVSPTFDQIRKTLSPQTWATFNAKAKEAEISVSGVLITAFTEVLKRWSQSSHFTIALTTFDRVPVHPDVDRLVGDFTSLLLLEVDTENESTFRGRAHRLQRRLWTDLDHRHVDGVDVLRERNRRLGIRPEPYIPVVFTSAVSLNRNRTDMDSLFWLGDPVYSVLQTPQVWLDVQVIENAGELIINWNWVTDILDRHLMRDAIDAYVGLLDDLANDPATWDMPMKRCRVESRHQEQTAPTAIESATNMSGIDEERTVPVSYTDTLDEKTEAKIIGAVTSVFALEPIDPLANLTALGATSVDIIRIIGALDRDLGIRLTINAVYRNPTISAIIDLCRRRSCKKSDMANEETPEN